MKWHWMYHIIRVLLLCYIICIMLFNEPAIGNIFNTLCMLYIILIMHKGISYLAVTIGVSYSARNVLKNLKFPHYLTD